MISLTDFHLPNKFHAICRKQRLVAVFRRAPHMAMSETGKYSIIILCEQNYSFTWVFVLVRNDADYHLKGQMNRVEMLRIVNGGSEGNLNAKSEMSGTCRLNVECQIWAYTAVSMTYAISCALPPCCVTNIIVPAIIYIQKEFPANTLLLLDVAPCRFFSGHRRFERGYCL
jgi:hypothetical protein